MNHTLQKCRPGTVGQYIENRQTECCKSAENELGLSGKSTRENQSMHGNSHRHPTQCSGHGQGCTGVGPAPETGSLKNPECAEHLSSASVVLPTHWHHTGHLNIQRKTQHRKGPISFSTDISALCSHLKQHSRSAAGRHSALPGCRFLPPYALQHVIVNALNVRNDTKTHEELERQTASHRQKPAPQSHS